jgi:hypothetical protein
MEQWSRLLKQQTFQYNMPGSLGSPCQQRQAEQHEQLSYTDPFAPHVSNVQQTNREADEGAEPINKPGCNTTSTVMLALPMQWVVEMGNP